MSRDDADSSSDGGTAILEHTFDEETPVSLAIVRTIATLENVDPIDCPSDLGFTLYDHVDPEALDAIAGDRRRGGPIRVDFTCDGYRIQVEDGGRIRVLESNDSPNDPPRS